MNTTEPDMNALAERHTAEMAHLPERDQQAIKLVVTMSMQWIMKLPDEAADIAIKHITETYQACCK